MITTGGLLSYLPWITIVWTAISLAWGVYAGISYTYMINWAMKNNGRVRQCDVPIAWILHSVNLFLLSYLWWDTVFVTVGAAILIVNLFYTTLLGGVTIQLIRWARAGNPSAVDKPLA
jgi:hypothetical protein